MRALSPPSVGIPYPPLKAGIGLGRGTPPQKASSGTRGLGDPPTGGGWVVPSLKTLSLEVPTQQGNPHLVPTPPPFLKTNPSG